MTYTKLLKLCLASLPVGNMIYHCNNNCYNVSQQPAVDKVSNIIFSRSSISVLVVLVLSNRGGVEKQGSRPRPRTLKKIQSQGQPLQGQTLSRPRTGMLEVKAKDQGHKRKTECSQKKGFQKNLKAISRKKRLPRNFSGTPQNFNNSRNSAVLEPRTGEFSRS